MAALTASQPQHPQLSPVQIGYCQAFVNKSYTIAVHVDNVIEEQWKKCKDQLEQIQKNHNFSRVPTSQEFESSRTICASLKEQMTDIRKKINDAAAEILIWQNMNPSEFIQQTVNSKVNNLEDLWKEHSEIYEQWLKANLTHEKISEVCELATVADLLSTNDANSKKALKTWSYLLFLAKTPIPTQRPDNKLRELASRNFRNYIDKISNASDDNKIIYYILLNQLKPDNRNQIEGEQFALSNLIMPHLQKLIAVRDARWKEYQKMLSECHLTANKIKSVTRSGFEKLKSHLEELTTIVDRNRNHLVLAQQNYETCKTILNRLNEKAKKLTEEERKENQSIVASKKLTPQMLEQFLKEVIESFQIFLKKI